LYSVLEVFLLLTCYITLHTLHYVRRDAVMTSSSHQASKPWNIYPCFHW